MSQTQIIEILFPQVFLLQANQDSIQSQNLIKTVINQSKHFVKENFLNQLNSSVVLKTKLQFYFHIEIICMGQFGCSVILHRQEKFHPISVTITFSTQWDFIQYLKESQTLYLPGDPKASASIQVGDLQKDYDSLIIAKEALKKAIAQILAEQTRLKDNKIHRTPTYLLEILRKALRQINTAKKVKKQQNQRILSKGGTLDVGIHTGITQPNTSLPIAISCLNYIFKDAQLVKFLIFSLKVKVLKQKIEGQKQYQAFRFKNYQNCICDLVSEAKVFVNQQTIFNYEYFSKQIEGISKILKGYIKPFPRKKILVDQLALSLADKNANELYFQSLCKYDTFTDVQNKKFGNLGFSKQFKTANFTNLLQDKLRFQEGYWIMMVERYFFNIAIQRLGPSNVQIAIDIKQISCSSKQSISKVHQIIYEYSKIIKDREKAKDYGMKLQNQSFSHYFLLRQIGSAIAFEVLKHERKDKKPNLQDYKCPLSIGNLYKLFYSLSYEARRALDAMREYWKRNSAKDPFFVLQKSNKSYYKFANELAQSVQTIKQWKHNTTKQLERQVHSIEDKLQSFRKKYETHKAEKKYQQEKVCSCFYQQINYYRYNHRQFRKCKRCKIIEQSTQLINDCQRQESKLIISRFAEQQINLYAFLNSIPLQILGVIKLLFENQIPFTVKQQSIPNNQFNNSYGELIIYVKEIKQTKFNLASNMNKDGNSLIVYPEPMPIFYYKKLPNCQQIQQEQVSPQIFEPALFQKSHQYMLNTPSISNTIREHQIYSKISLKKKEESINEYINFGSIRVAVHTELILLSYKLKNRELGLKFIIETQTLKNAYQKQLFLKTLIILNSSAYLQSFKYYNEGNPIVYPFIKQCIIDLLRNYLVKWKHQDFYFLHPIGIIFSLMSKLLDQEKSVIEIALFAYEKFQIYAKQNGNGDNTVKSQLAYFLHGIMSFFNQNITVDKRSIHLWTKLHLLYRINKIFSDQNLKDQRYRNTMSFFQHYRERSIFNNINTVLQYFQKNLSDLTQIIKMIDLDCTLEVIWTYSSQKGYYVFTGISGDKVYEVNLFTGILLKNGSQLAGLPEIIKNNEMYISIFGKNRDLQVYTQKDGSLRTRKDFSSFFQNQPNTIILFEFKIHESSLIIRKIMKILDKEIKYVLIPQSILTHSNTNLPEMYSNLCFAWYSQQQKILVFRDKALEKMKNINLIILLQRIQTRARVIQARIVQNNLKQYSIQYLKQQSYSSLFDLLILSEKQGSNAIKILSSIQHPAYILKISSPNRSQTTASTFIKFWLHRYNLKFTFSPQLGLLSDNYQGYAVAQEYDSHQYLPWTYQDKVKCLMLKKIDDNIRFTKNHKYLLLIPNTTIVNGNKQKNSIPIGPTICMKMFSYELHDHFHDLRSKKILDQLHLACLTAVCYSPSNILTNIQYSIYLLRSCYGLKPLNQQEEFKLQNILRNAIELNQCQLILVCYVVYMTTKLLEDILPYQKQRKPKSKKQQQNLFQKYADLIQNCKFIFRTKFASQQISVRLQLSDLQLNILRMSSYRDIHIGSAEKSKWNSKNKSVIAIPQYFGYKMRMWVNDLYDSYEIKHQIVTKNKEQNQKISQFETVINIEGTCQMSIDQKKQIQSSLKSYSKIQIKLSHLNINNKDKQSYIKKFKDARVKLLQSSQQISKEIYKMQEGNNSNLSFISKKRSIIKQIDFTNILCSQSYFFLFYPESTQRDAQLFKKTIQLWMKINIEFDSIQRILEILKDEEVDKISLLREVESPRFEISKNVAWIAFEMQLKTQIWLSQYETFKLLESNKSGVVTQLNMGEGKTQVIIPMIVLNEIYNKKANIPRVNILTPLFHEAQENYFKFLSITGFKLHLLPLCFNRQVEVSQKNIKRLQYAIEIFKQNSLVLIDRDSALSTILKLREQYGIKRNQIDQNFQLSESSHKKDRWFFRNKRVLDIFDEVDALMTAKKSFVYAVGSASQLPHSRIRFEYSFLLIEIIIKELLKYLLDQQMAVIEQSYDHARPRILQGKYLKGFRLIAKIPRDKIMQFRQKLVKLFFEKYLPPELQFYKSLSKQEQGSLAIYCVDQNVNISFLPQSLSKEVHDQIYLVRGLIAYGLLEHCLALRNGVEYGAPGKDNLKRVGVPYQAADMPSKRSEYSHPQVAIILSYLSYYNKGLSYPQFCEALKNLLRQKSSSGQKNSFQQQNYKSWVDCIEKQQMKPRSAKEVQQINEESVTQRQELYNAFKYCRSTVAFWLVHCVFPNDLLQYTKSITSSSWDLADSQKSVGFSGTKDTHWLFPEYVYLKESSNDQINGTDGKMIQLMLQNTIDVQCIQMNSQDLWKRFCQKALQLKSGCIIDAGAILAGKSLEREIVPWISNRPLFKKMHFKGILYCNQGVWKVYDTTTHSTIARETSIPEHETFVIFDEARTRGADIKMKTQTIAALSLGPYMTKDKLMQAVGRLRKFGRNQKIYLLSTQDVLKTIQNFSLEYKNEQKVKMIIEWVCKNSLNDNKKLLYPNSKLAWIHFNNKKSQQEVVVQQFNPTLSKMYESIIKFETVQNLNQQMAFEHIKRYGDCQLVLYLQETILKYGNNYLVRCQNLQDICQRQIQMVQQTYKQTEIQTVGLDPIEEQLTITLCKGKISSLDIKLNDKLMFSSNFLKCTKQKVSFKKPGDQSNQLCQINFVFIRPKEKSVLVVTQKQASSLIQKGVYCLPPSSLDQFVEVEFVARFQDLSIKHQCIMSNELERALTDAQFFNGRQKFQSIQLFEDTIRKNETILNKVNIQRIICHFLQRRRAIQDKYTCSDLEKVYKKIICSK